MAQMLREDIYHQPLRNFYRSDLFSKYFPSYHSSFSEILGARAGESDANHVIHTATCGLKAAGILFIRFIVIVSS